MHKYNFGIIGNCSYLALINTDADVVWMCWPRFDSSFIFGNLLDEKKGGQFSITPEWDDYTSKQAYIPNTNILETTFNCEDGIYKVTDCAPRFRQHERFYKPLLLVRKIEPVKGTPRVRVICRPKGEYGKVTPEPVYGSNHIGYKGLSSSMRMTTNIPLSFIEGEQAFVLTKTMYIVMTYGAPLEAPLESTADIFIKKTVNYWHHWIKCTAIQHFSQEAVIRSALTLKLHQYQDTGAIIAAATSSLPEYPGSTRNWDYRYCWIRDAHYTLKALNDLSHFKILEHYSGFIQNIALGEQGRIKPLYSIAMDKEPVEKIMPLAGYQGERPVRVGNQAHKHIQNDVYGQVLVTILPLFVDKRLTNELSDSLVNLAKLCLDKINETMDEPDNGLWEFRGERQRHCYTFLFHWAGSCAAKHMAKVIKDEEMEAFAIRLIDQASAQIEKCYDPRRGAYVQAIGSNDLDASLLQMINMGYLPADSEKAKSHLKAMEEELKTKEGLFYRYKHKDDFGEPQSTFLICAYWYVEALAKMNRVEEAIELFNHLLSYSNHLGLMSEDVDAETGSQWGNFPQLYSHVGLINAAFAIAKKKEGALFL